MYRIKPKNDEHYYEGVDLILYKNRITMGVDSADGSILADVPDDIKDQLVKMGFTITEYKEQNDGEDREENRETPKRKNKNSNG